MEIRRKQLVIRYEIFKRSTALLYYVLILSSTLSIYKCTLLHLHMLFQTGASWLYVVPRGIYNVLHYAKQTYDIDLFYITENGNLNRISSSIDLVLPCWF